SKGVFIVASSAELDARIGESRRFSIDGAALVEELIEGTQHTCEALLHDGRIALALVTDRDTAAHGDEGASRAVAALRRAPARRDRRDRAPRPADRARRRPARLRLRR